MKPKEEKKTPCKVDIKIVTSGDRYTSRKLMLLYQCLAKETLEVILRNFLGVSDGYKLQTSPVLILECHSFTSLDIAKNILKKINKYDIHLNIIYSEDGEFVLKFDKIL